VRPVGVEETTLEIGPAADRDAAAVVALHAGWYARHWGFGPGFAAKVEGELAEFLARRQPARDLFLCAHGRDSLIGTVTLDVTGGGPAGVHLRWFIVAEAAQGMGLGARLLHLAMEHNDRMGGGPVWLTTFAGLDAARRLYERHGFALARESDDDQWQGGVREQLFIRPAGYAANKRILGDDT
jgi:GNAT superfamily N-acetyltransferase